MPTGSRLVGAVAFAMLGYLIAGAAVATLPEGVTAPWLTPVAVALMVLHGWTLAGASAGQGWYLGAVNGLRTSLQATILGVAYFALYEMFSRAMSQRTYEVGEAALEALGLFLEYGEQILVRPVVGLVLVGGLVAGILTEAAGQRWR